jgi:hypothetical protein
MSNSRGAGQRMLTFWADAELLADIEKSRGRKDRSQFIREAIAEKLKGMGIHVREDLIYPPSRAQVINFSGHNAGSISQVTTDPGEYKVKRKKKGKK